MTRFLLLLAALPTALLAGSSDPARQVISTEEAYVRALNRDGGVKAFRAFWLPQGEVFIPERVRPGELEIVTEPPIQREASKVEHVWTSCDATIGVTQSRWRVPQRREQGWRETIWARLSNGTWRILLQNQGSAPRKLFSRPGRKGLRAACNGKPPPLPILAPDVGTDFKLGASHDQTLIWSSAVSAEGQVRIVISLWNGKTFDPVLEDVAPAPIAR